MPKIAPAEVIEALDLPRSRSGLNVYYELLSRTTPDLRCVIRSAPAAAADAPRAWAFLTLRPVGRSAGGGRWMHSPAGADLLVERVVAKDNYETPSHIWRHAIVAHRLNRDAHASSLNAVMRDYDWRNSPGPLPGARYWLNPAFGSHCGGIGSVLEKYVWQQGCAVVALLPALLHMSW